MKFVSCFELGWWCRGDFWLGDWHLCVCVCVCVCRVLSVMLFAICVHVSVPENDSFMISTLMADSDV